MAWSRSFDRESCATKHARACSSSCGGTHSVSDIARLFAAQEGKCVGCKATLVSKGKGKYHIDHMMPLSRGGSNGAENLQLLCPPCNMSKSNKTQAEWDATRAS